jgi:hypothetical protein
MRRVIRTLLVGVVSALTAGCITSETVLKVQADGSGTIEQTLSMRRDAAEQLTKIMAGMQRAAPSKDANASPELFSEADMRKAAGKLGTGVSFVSSQAISTPDRVGRVAVYAFTDITQLRVDQSPPAPGGAELEAATGGARPEAIQFKLSKLPGGNSLVTVLFPEPSFERTTTTGTKPKPSPEQLAQMKQMLDGLKIDVELEPQGTLVKTNSPYVTGNRVTLVSLDFGEVLKNDAALERLGHPQSIEEAKAMLKDVKGVKVNLDKEVTVEFAGR